MRSVPPPDAGRPAADLPSVRRLVLDDAPGLELWWLPVPGTGADDAVARRLLGKALSTRLGPDAAAMRIARAPCPVCGAPQGRPVLVDRPEQPGFSVTRTRGLVVVALADGPVGVDAERWVAGEVSAAVTMLLHPKERLWLTGLSGTERPRAFTRAWVRKEAYLKAVGTGVAHGLDGQAVHAQAPAGWIVREVPLGPDHAVAVSIRSPR